MRARGRYIVAGTMHASRRGVFVEQTSGSPIQHENPFDVHEWISSSPYVENYTYVGIVRQLMLWLGEAARRVRLVYLRMSSVKVGRNVFISFGARIDAQFGEIEIGDDVHITHGACILAHDGAVKHT